MADLAYKVTADTSQAKRNLESLNKGVLTLQKTFDGLKSAIGAIAFGSFISSSLRFAASMVDVANSTDLALEAVVGFSRAVQNNGGDVLLATKGLEQFNVKIGEAAEGMPRAQEAFERVGISLQDLETLSQQDLLRRTIQGLAQIEDASLRAKLAGDLLGQSLRKIDLKGLAQDYDTAVRGSVAYVEAIRTADQVQSNLENAITDLQIALLAVLQPVGELAKSISTNIDSIVKWTSVIFEFLKVFAGFFIVGRVLGLVLKFANGIRGLVTGLIGAKDAFAKITKEIGGSGLIYLFTNLGKVVGKLKDLMGQGSINAFRFSNRLVKIIEGARSAAIAVAGLTLSFLGLDKAMAKLEEFKEDFSKPLVIQGEGAQAIPEGYFEKRRQKQREVEDALKKEIAAIKQVSEAYKDVGKEILNNLDLELKYLGMTERQAELEKTIDGIRKNQADTVKKLEAELEKLPAADTRRREAIQETINAVNAETEATINGVKQKLPLLQAEREAIEARNRAIEFGETVRRDEESLQAMRDEIDMLYMTASQREEYKKKLEIEANLKRRLAEIDKEAATVGKNATDSQIEDWERRRKAAIDYYNTEKELQDQYKEAQDDQGRQIQVWAEETREALEESISPANQVKNFWDGLSDQIDNFARTGKFKVKEFLASIIQDFIAAKLKLAALDFLKSIGLGGGGGLFGGAIIPGFLAGGGNAQQGKPYIVGEKGPELFVPPTAGRVVPNYAMKDNTVSAPVTNNYITNNISALDAQSVAQLFAANRKTLLGTVRLAEKELPYAG